MRRAMRSTPGLPRRVDEGLHRLTSLLCNVFRRRLWRPCDGASHLTDHAGAFPRRHREQVLDEAYVHVLVRGIVGEPHGQDVHVETSGRNEGPPPERAHLVSREGSTLREDDQRLTPCQGPSHGSHGEHSATAIPTLHEEGPGTASDSAEQGPVGHVGAAEHRTSEAGHQDQDVQYAPMVGHDEPSAAGASRCGGEAPFHPEASERAPAETAALPTQVPCPLFFGPPCRLQVVGRHGGCHVGRQAAHATCHSAPAAHLVQPGIHLEGGYAESLPRWQAGEVPEELSPGLLAASPSLRCPFFHHAVVLLVDHDEDGTFGLVLNRESDVTFAQVATQLDLELVEGGSALEVPVLTGGPVSPETGWVLFDPAEHAPRGDALQLSERLALSASMLTLEALGRGEGPERALLALGYAGWAPGQLERELREGAWLPLPLDERIVFDVPVSRRWRCALSSLGIDPARVASHGSA